MIPYQLARSANMSIPQLLFCYGVIYFLVPLFIPKRKYLYFVFSILIFSILSFVLSSLWFSANGWLARFLSDGYRFTPFITKFYAFYSNINFMGAVPACCLMLAIKYYKDWHIKQKQSEILFRDNAQVELQLLKAQVHPHFLFNTLNNIYSFTLTGSPKAAELIDKLSGMMDYMADAGEKSLVPLEKELNLVRDYIGLEKVRYGDRLKIHMDITGDYEKKMIAPLLMIPFVENCFKHGPSEMRGQQWIRFEINISNDWLVLFLSNSKLSKPIARTGKKGIGLANVQKRLELLYHERYFLNIEATNGTYLVQLQVPLDMRLDTPIAELISTIQQPVSYA